ncbi:MAG: host attachment protein [Pseudomonadales bacterium]|nr:host attachment protein [Pseudomonadales bacterium]
MKTLCLVLGDGVRAKLYLTSYPPRELKLIYHQANFGGSASDFAGGLCKRLGADLRAGKFDALVLMASHEFLLALDRCMDEGCRRQVLGKLVVGAEQFTEQELAVRLQDLLASRPLPANLLPKTQ